MNPVFFLLLIVVAIGGIAFHFSRGNSMLERWAINNGYQIVDQEFRWLRSGPFWFRSTKGQQVYRITVKDLDGSIRSGYARCGGFFLGMLSDRVDVIWDEPPQHRPGFPVMFSTQPIDQPDEGSRPQS